MIRTITRPTHSRETSWFGHQHGTRLADKKKQCHSCRNGKHDCRSIHCMCARCGAVPKEK